MKTMFTEFKKKTIPQSLSDCYKNDSITDNLWLWCERLEKFGKILFWFIIVGGIITAFATSFSTETVTKGTYYTYTDTETEFNIALFITSLLRTALYAILEYCAYHAIALLLAALASLVMNTKITANIALYTNAKKEPKTAKESHIKEKNSVEEEEAKEIKKLKEEQEKFVADSCANRDSWLCPECCRENSANSTKCKCGYVKE